jgi:hypothetical protein
MANLLLTSVLPGNDAPRVHASAAVVVASFGDPVARDYAASLAQSIDVDLSCPGAITRLQAFDRSDVVLFLPQQWNADRMILLDSLLEQGVKRITIISTFRVHFGDDAAMRAESYVLDRVKGTTIRTMVIRPAHVLGERAPATVNLRRIAFLAPLVPARLRSCCIDANDLFAAINRARGANARNRVWTVLGPNRSWKDRLRDYRGRGFVQACLTLVSLVLALLLVGQAAALLLDLFARWQPSLQCWSFDTLRPRSLAELLALCNPCNMHVKVVGYNNGVVHFGHRFPDKTVISTVHCHRIVRTRTDEIKADCGATVRDARNFVAASQQELYVVPNYSYVCLGTAFFVPIHGSASDCATLAETITQIVLYDPSSDRFIRATSDESDFRERVYRIDGRVVLLRLRLRVKPRVGYVVRRELSEHTDAAKLLDALRDTQCANVEIRKSKGTNSKVEIAKYYPAGMNVPGAVELPRDALGCLWDRLEENALTSFLMHALTRWFAWHVELFFTADEFRTFWQTHQTLPLRKIQLRYIRRDGLPHSPFRDDDCVSVDMFMLRWNRAAFETYLSQTFAIVRTNPGKHSQ